MTTHALLRRFPLAAFAMVAAHAVKFADQHARAFGHTEPGHLGNRLDAFADDLRVQRVCSRRYNSRQRGFLFRSQKVRAFRQQAFAHLRINRPLGDNRLLRRTDGAVIKGFAGENIFDGFRDIGRALDHRWHVVGADAEGRLARRISRAHQADAACSQNYSRPLVLH